MKQKNKKKAILLMSSRFPATNPEAGKETSFKEKLEKGQKIHTIRKNREWWNEKAEKINSGDMALHLRSWTGLPYNSKQEEWAICDNVGIQSIDIYFNNGWVATVDGKSIPIEEIAKNDGLGVEQFENWFFDSKSDPHFQEFHGVIIHFTKFRYK
jgi:hypothetical protein